MARDFGTNQYLDIGTQSDLNITGTGITICGWAKRDSQGFAFILNRRNSSNLQYQFAWLDSGNNNELRFDADYGSGTVSYDSGSSHTETDTWHHLAVVYDGSNVTFYFDGSSDGSSSETGSIASHNIPNSIGRDNGSFPNYSDAKICEVAIWDTPLSANEISSLAAGISPFRIRNSSLQGYWPIWGYHSPEIDLSKNHHTATVTGASLANHSPVLNISSFPETNLFLPDPNVEILIQGSGIISASASAKIFGESNIVGSGIISSSARTLNTVNGLAEITGSGVINNVIGNLYSIGESIIQGSGITSPSSIAYAYNSSLLKGSGVLTSQAQALQTVNGESIIQGSGLLSYDPTTVIVAQMNMFVQGAIITSSTNELGLFTLGLESGVSNSFNSAPLYVEAGAYQGEMNLYVAGSGETPGTTAEMNLFLTGEALSASGWVNFYLYNNVESISNSANLFVEGLGTTPGFIPVSSEMNLYLLNQGLSESLTLYSLAKDSKTAQSDLYTFGGSGYTSSLNLYTYGLASLHATKPLFTRGYSTVTRP